MTAWSSLSNFVEKNKTAAIVTATVLAAGTGAGLYYVLSQQPSLTSSEADNESSSSSSPTAGTSEKKKSKKKNKKKAASAAATATGAAATGSVKESSGTELLGFPLTKESANAPEYPVINDFSVVTSLPADQKQKLAASFKAAGNDAYGSKKYEKAIELYSSAIKCDPTDPIFYSNRAACYSALQNFEKVIEDTTKALELKPDYIKCLSRRAIAEEKLEKYPDAILDFTSACILGDFQDKNLNNAVDRVLRLNSEKIANEKYATQPKTLPSSSFVSAYLNSFHERQLPASLNEAVEGTGEYNLKLAFDALSKETAESYEQAFDLIKKSVDEIKDDELLALALEYRGTFNFLLNEGDEALDDIEKSIKLHPTVQAYIKRSSVQMERGSVASANQDFEQALKLDPKSADVYYHRAQIAFLTSDFNAAISDYKQSIELNPDFMYSHIQLAVAQYRQGSTSEAITAFRNLLEKYPKSSDVHNYYGEILLDQGSGPDALKEFDIAIKLETEKSVGTVNVLALVNKALTVFQLNQDVAEAESLCRKAVTIDPLSDVAISTLAQFCLQQNKTEDALELFERNAEIARTVPERVQALSFAEAARTQLRIIKERPALRQRLEAISRQSAHM
ncbi:protein channel TOM70 [Sugiyamaella lignohabitans]|uniref:Protein channel TOM70 n=1 Tax=Sugiyamaella lignohabitans TaxID=796027 RepID=A0A167DDC9_9ASCO|nr:protein channel TOM70 [Sugiyamaella lignohabitans]ANB12785.1 protein channel TOM70 [Sugiyamaella lignohabitans]